MLALTASVSAYGQASFEVTPLFGGRFGGSLKVEQDGQANRKAPLDDDFSFGVAAGFRFDGDDCESCSIVDFRWMRQNTHLGLTNTSLPAAVAQPRMTMDHFLADFTREFPVGEPESRIKPFVTASAGAVLMSTPLESRTRFEFGIGAGVNVFPKPRWGLHFQVEYLPIVMHADVQQVVCAGGCVVIINGGVMNQVVVSVGPIFRLH